MIYLIILKKWKNAIDDVAKRWFIDELASNVNQNHLLIQKNLKLLKDTKRGIKKRV